MKRVLFLLAMAFSIGCVSAQYIVYSNLKSLLAQEGDSIPYLEVEKRSKNQITLQGGADYRIYHPDNKSLCHYLKRRPYAVMADSSLYINCKRIHYKRLRFGQLYAPAFVMTGIT